MQQRITGFHQDEERHWVARLECGHTQHVRHDPPWQMRPWVLTEESRNSRLGSTLNCILCDTAAAAPQSGAPADDNAITVLPPGLSPAAARAYLDARMQGLCHEGALEVARSLAQG
jgi:hypothetical protein